MINRTHDCHSSRLLHHMPCGINGPCGICESRSSVHAKRYKQKKSPSRAETTLHSIDCKVAAVRSLERGHPSTLRSSRRAGAGGGRGVGGSRGRIRYDHPKLVPSAVSLEFLGFPSSDSPRVRDVSSTDIELQALCAHSAVL